VNGLWTKHGTKILATAQMAVGAIQAADLQLTQLLTMKQHAFVSLAAVVVGAMTLKRGFTNSAGGPPT
jgi:hypothetical protein